jgi:hypothetical protein
MENEKKFNAYIFYRPKQGKYYGTRVEKPFGVIYKITNKTNGLIYIGQTTDLKRRIRYYKAEANTNNTPKFLHDITRAMREERFDNFKFEIIEECPTVEKLDVAECRWIARYNSTNPNYGYNCEVGGGTKRDGTVTAFRHSEEHKAKMRKGLIVYNKENGKFNLIDSAKSVSDIFHCDRAIISRCAKHGQIYHGFYFYYQDADKRTKTVNEVSAKTHAKGREDRRKYCRVCRFINEVGVETIESKTFKF